MKVIFTQLLFSTNQLLIFSATSLKMFTSIKLSLNSEGANLPNLQIAHKG